ncbi:Uma2 family endonuclease [Chroococcidiopsis sp. CCNUC1]|uniref:Uma2 family endonuclease n=1 Tax=Chroococcidiopsis sp. CCNUC1 TaxID=2653189 RepID=UPI0020213677|nr:Uma2 family endonuclease [Chroococcidiopsis sp. CCNUC1]URD53842.1 Uma2 family endonuclease [Chroococcidiopsis sp. CCNUC1]
MTVTTAKWTLEDYHCMIEVGLLEDRHVELLNGEIVEMPPEGPEHAYLGDEVGKYLRDLLGDRAQVREGHPVTLPNDSEPEPDLAIVKPLGQTYRQHHPYVEDVFWLIEYANTSLNKDLDAKRKTYATTEIQEYWVVDLKHRQLKVFRTPSEGDYTLEETLIAGEISPMTFPDVVISVPLLFGGCNPVADPLI